MAYYIPHQINNIPPHTSSAVLSILCFNAHLLLFGFVISSCLISSFHSLLPSLYIPHPSFVPLNFAPCAAIASEHYQFWDPFSFLLLSYQGFLDLAVFCWRRVSHNQQKFNLIISLEKVLKRCKLARVLACDSAMLLNFFHRVKLLLLTLPNYLFFHLMK